MLTTAYFIVAEGVTNALKHARPTRLTIRAGRRDDGRLLVEVEDDGAGVPAEGVELTTLRDRVGAVGGSLELTAQAPQGTVLRAVL
jgi:two-component system sensor histidine kinase UhpB